MKTFVAIFNLWFGDNDVEEVMERKREEQRLLDVRYNNIQKATIDGEDDWFLTLKRRDPSCVVRVLSECGEVGKDDKHL